MDSRLGIKTYLPLKKPVTALRLPQFKYCCFLLDLSK